MASSSVSQEDVDNDYEKLERRSRIRCARARQINPQGCRMENAVVERLPSSTLPLIGIEIEDSLDQLGLEAANISPYQAEGDQASPKPVARSRDVKDTRDARESREKRPSAKLVYHANPKGKQQRDRRKLREKRRSTGVVHLASTESTGGSTTGDDAEDGGEILGLCSETRRNTQQNESVASSPGAAEIALPQEVSAPERKNSGHHKLNSPQSVYTSQGATGTSHAKSRLRDKSPRSEDLEADDEQGDKTDNDHDSLNLSESSSAISIIAPPAGITPCGGKTVCAGTPTPNSSMVGLLTCDVNSSASTPVLRPTTPILVDSQVDDTQQLIALLEEKDRRIQILELKVEQLLQDTLSITEEHSRLQKENASLLRAVNNLAKK